MLYFWMRMKNHCSLRVKFRCLILDDTHSWQIGESSPLASIANDANLFYEMFAVDMQT